jgi:DNA-binding XRE family transcriptional regulator
MQLEEIKFDSRLLQAARTKAFPEKSASEVAALLGIKPATLCDFEKGRAHPSLKIGLRMSFIYGVDLRDLTNADKPTRTFFEKSLR